MILSNIFIMIQVLIVVNRKCRSTLNIRIQSSIFLQFHKLINCNKYKHKEIYCDKWLNEKENKEERIVYLANSYPLYLVVFSKWFVNSPKACKLNIETKYKIITSRELDSKVYIWLFAVYIWILWHHVLNSLRK